MSDHATVPPTPTAPTSGAPGPDAPRERPVRTVVFAVAVVAIVVTVAVVALGRGGDERAAEALGGEIGNAMSAVDRAESVMRTAAAAEESSLADDASCWFSYPPGSDEPSGHLVCGPVLFLDSDADSPWITVPVEFGRTEDGVFASVGDEVLDRSVPLGDAELVHPDGKQPPEPDIDLPDPPPAEAGHVAVGDVPAPIELDESPDDGRLVGSSYGITVEAFDHVDRVKLPDGSVASAAAGEHWLVAEVRGEGSGSGGGDANFSLVVDGRREEISQLVSYGTTEVVLYASVPTDAEDVSLAATETDLDQSWSFTTQERSDSAPDVYYRDLASLSTDVDVNVSLPYAVDTTHDQLDVGFGDEEATITVGSVGIGYLVTDSNQTIFAPSATDRAFVFLTDVAFSSRSVTGYQVSERDMVLTTDDGEQIDATRLSDHGPTGMIDGAVVWEVPADIAGGTIAIALGSGPDTYQTTRVVDFQDGEVTVPFTFG